MLPTPYAIGSRLVLFASRMSEVQEPQSQIEMGEALAEIHRNVITLVTGVALVILPPSTPLDNLCAALTALLRHGPVATPRDRDGLEQLNACVDGLFEGLVWKGDPAVPLVDHLAT